MNASHFSYFFFCLRMLIGTLFAFCESELVYLQIKLNSYVSFGELTGGELTGDFSLDYLAGLI